MATKNKAKETPGYHPICGLRRRDQVAKPRQPGANQLL